MSNKIKTNAVVSRLYSIHALTPLHVGTGEGVGGIDLPIMREKVTEWPFIPGSTIKGVKRAYYTAKAENNKDDDDITRNFGRDQETDSEASAGVLVFSDARLLAFPVASGTGTFAYVTCPLAITRFQRDMTAAGQTIRDLDEYISTDSQPIDVTEKLGQKAWVCSNSSFHAALSKSDHPQNRSANEPNTPPIELTLDEFEMDAQAHPGFTEWAKQIGTVLFAYDDYTRRLWSKHLVLVPDYIFQQLTHLCTEVIPRIRIDSNTGTVQKGALWTEEYIPTEAVLYGLIWCDRLPEHSTADNRQKHLRTLDSYAVLQIGGNTTIGKGRVQFYLYDPEAVTSTTADTKGGQ